MVAILYSTLPTLAYTVMCYTPQPKPHDKGLAMKDLNWLLAVKRTYYVLWAVAVIICLLATFGELVTGGNVLDRGIGLMFSLVVPFLVLKASQWVFSGLHTKDH